VGVGAGRARAWLHVPEDQGTTWAAELHLSSWDLGMLGCRVVPCGAHCRKDQTGEDWGAEQEWGKAGGFLKPFWFPGEGGGALTGVHWWLGRGYTAGDMALPRCGLRWPCPSLLQDAGEDRREQGLTVGLGVRVAPSQEAEQGQNSWVLGYV